MMRLKVEDNQQKRLFIRLDQGHVQKFIDLTQKQFRSKPIIEYRYSFIRDRTHVLIPLNQKYKKEILGFLEANSVIEYELIQREAIVNPKFKYRTIEDVLREESIGWASNLIPKSYDMIGTIAIVEFPDLSHLSNKENKRFKKAVAKAIIIVNKSIKSVYEKKSQIKGEYRLRDVQFLHGIDNPETIHKENQVFFKVNIKKVYFTPRLVNERKRIADNPINKGELIVDLFAGVGPFSIQIAKNNEVKIHSFDINMDAYEYLKENIKLNKVNDRVNPHNNDIKKLLESNNQLGKLLKDGADRIIMNLPEKSLEFLDVACFLIKESGGIIHNYQFCEKPNPVELAIERFTKALSKYNYRIEAFLNADAVKSYSPTSELISLDVSVISK